MGRDKSSPRIQNPKTPDRRDERVLLSQNLMRDNPVISRGSQNIIYQSDINLSVLNETSPFKLSEIQPEVKEEEMQLRRKLVELESRRGITITQSLLTTPRIEQSSNQMISI